MKKTLWIAFQSLLMCSALLVGVQSAEATLVGHWDLDEGVGTTVIDSVSGNNGTVTFIGSGAEGWSGSNLRFQGGTRVDIPGLAAYNLQGNDFTWAMFTQIENGNNFSSLMSKGPGGGWAAGWRELSSRVAGPEWNNFAVSGFNTGTGIFDGSEHHVAMTATVSGLSIYVDGLLAGNLAGDFRGGLDNDAWGFNLGTGPGITGALDGFIRDVRVYDNALTQPQIQALITPVPEPSSFFLMASAAASTISLRRRRI